MVDEFANQQLHKKFIATSAQRIAHALTHSFVHPSLNTHVSLQVSGSATWNDV